MPKQVDPKLFKFEKSSAADNLASSWGGHQGAPALWPIGVQSVDALKEAKSTISVVEDFAWTASLRTGVNAKETPSIRFREYYVIGNAVQTQAVYMLKYGMNAAAGGLVGGILGGTVGAVVGAGAATALKKKGYLEPYAGLYDVTPTGFIYDFPMIEDQFRSTQTQWAGPTVGKTPIGEAYEEVRKSMQALGTDAAILLDEPNAFVEEAKQYNHSRDGNKFNIKFYLSNTGTYTDVVRNWHLQFMLMYQNLPNRTSAVLLRPPVIYEIEMPGIMYHPYAALTDVRVNYLGAQRKMQMEITSSTGYGKSGVTPTGPIRPVGASSGLGATAAGKLMTNIPDAYEIVLTIEPLVKETQNFLYQSTTSNSTLYDVEVKDIMD
jgi:hypothetical protein